MSRVDLEELRGKLWEVAHALEHETRGSISPRARKLRRIMKNVDASANDLAAMQGIDPNLDPNRDREEVGG